MVTCVGIYKSLSVSTYVELQMRINQFIISWIFLSRVLDLDDIKKCKHINIKYIISTVSHQIKYWFEREKRTPQEEAERTGATV